MQRIASGKTTRIGKASLDKFGMTMEQVNDIRRCNGLGDLRSPLDPAPPCQSPNSPMEIEAADAPQSQSGSEHNAESEDITLASLMEMAWSLVGKQQIDKYGDLMFTRDGQPKVLQLSTVKDYRYKFSQLYHKLKCNRGVVECFKDAQNVVDFTAAEYKKGNTAKTYFNAIVSFAKYLPDFNHALGDAAYKIYHKAMKQQIKKGDAAMVEKTRTTQPLPLKELLQRLETAKTNFGETSPEYVLAELQVKLKGLRGELGSVKIVDSSNPSLRTTPNYYLPASGRLVIRRFKTWQDGYDPYEFTLPADLKAIVDTYLASRRNPRFLIRDKATSSADIGDMLHKAIGVKINGIRHAVISHLLHKDHSEAHAREIAPLFKHRWQTTMRYFQNKINNDSSDN